MAPMSSEPTVVTFSVNGRPQKVVARSSDDEATPGTSISPTTSLADFLRQQQRLPGTKTMCREGMCGVCVVTVTSQNPATGEMDSRAVNSCLTPLLSCQGWQIQTVEGIGSKRDGLHPVQARLAHLHGSQCGYCSPGMTMAMYSALKSGGPVTRQAVDDALDGHLCRCTGYRPIVDAFNTFVDDADSETQALVKDIEDAAGCHGRRNPDGSCQPAPACIGCPRTIYTGGAGWRRPAELTEAISDLAELSSGGATVRLVAGNTATGVLDKYEPPSDSYISLLALPELRAIQRPSSEASAAVFGAAVTLSELIRELQLLSSAAGYRHCAEMARHLRQVANTPVRNAGTWAGNLMIRHKHREFPSDVFLLLTAAGATLRIAEGNTVEEMRVEQMYEISMKNRIIVSMTLPPVDDNKYVFKSYKISPRASSAHAYVNAAFVFPYDEATSEVTGEPAIIYGGISDSFSRAVNTERYLCGRRLDDEATVQGALTTLLKEVQPQADPELAAVEYRRNLAVNLLYKMMLHTLGERVPAALRSGAGTLTRPPMRGEQQFHSEENEWPVNRPVVKLEAEIQTSGEAHFTDDQPAVAGELYAAYVLTTVGSATIASVDASEALALPGVVDFVTAKHVAGRNAYYSAACFIDLFGIDRAQLGEQMIFAEDRVQYCGQALGLVLADSSELARRAARLVRVHYTDVRAPTTSLRQAVETQPDARSQSRVFSRNIDTGDVDGAMSSARHTVSGEFEMGGQYHHYMETQAVRVVPGDDGQLSIFSATQCAKEAMDVVTAVTNVPQHKIHMEVTRLGGGFGGKELNAAPIAAAAAVAALRLRRPVRLALDLETNMLMCGHRFPHLINYQVGFDDTGRIQALNVHIVSEQGAVNTVSGAVEHSALMGVIQSAYSAGNWRVTPSTANTHVSPNVSARAPGCVNAITTVEVIMEHIAHELGMEPWKVRLANFDCDLSPQSRSVADAGSDADVFGRMVDEMFDSANIVQRQAEIETFNQENRWRKRALAMQPMRYWIMPFFKMPCLVSIYDADGTVAVSSGGVEMGQGLNTKVAQTVSRELAIPLELISVKPNNSLVNPNGSTTGGSVGSETASFAAQLAARELMSRLKPFRVSEDGTQRSWLQTVRAASDAAVNLTAHSWQPPDIPAGCYTVWAMVAAEVELDVLTGESCFRRVDLYEDAGQPLSPAIDVGQIEGAFAFGMGLLLTEKHRVHPQTAHRITSRCWNYYIPTHKDMPRDFRVKLLKNNHNPLGIYNSKATGEPALCMAAACVNALRRAVSAARRDRGDHSWVTLDTPATAETVQTACAVSAHKLLLS